MDPQIAIIDNGVSALTIPDLCFDMRYDACKGIVPNHEPVSPYSHGSICAAIIRKYAPFAKLGSIRVLAENGRGELSALLCALEWCATSGVQIIHLSAGSVQASDIPALRQTVDKAVSLGCTIVSACKNGRNVSFPASFSNVIGVRADPDLTGCEYHANTSPGNWINFSAGSNHELRLAEGFPLYSTPAANSFAAPVITAQLIRIHPRLQPYSIQQAFTDLNSQLGSNQISPLFGPCDAHIFKDVSSIGNRCVLLFLGKSETMLMQGIATNFVHDNFFPLMFSTYREDCGECCWWIKPAMVQDECQRMAEFCGADVILALVGEGESDIPADVYVKGAAWSSAEQSRHDRLYLSSTNSNIERLYNKILAFLEK